MLEGLEAATPQRIAETAGCTTGRLTLYFGSKDDVLVTALREVHQRAGRRMGIQAALEPAAFTDARLRRPAGAIVSSVL